ncbi:site-specific integrase [Oceanihabitans sediminis]|uniref:site-specific integrase n=1 Tax=Oceanihabitans sediminis TaxID=1812012 RepID=UPI00299EF8A2|nr:site-specific integrase [Oceanihabitans sediminis]MDX1279295.1 site-specific integrase [Oceanihabitans sediminis]
MKASIKLMASEKPTEKGYPVYVRLQHQGKRYKKCIGYSHLHDWDEIKSRPLKTHPEYLYLLPVVLEYYAKTIKVNLENYTFADANALLFGEAEKQYNAGYLAFFDVRINEKKIKGHSYNSYKNVRSIIKEYIKTDDVPLNDITYEWLNKFVLYKLQNGANYGGVMSYLRDMRAVYKEAQRRESLNVNTGNPFLGVITNPTPKPVIALSVTDFKKLLEFNFNENTSVKNKKSMNQRLAVWLFQFYIGGHDYIDVSLLTWENIEGDRVRFKRYKNRNKKHGGPEVNNVLVFRKL